MVDMDESLPWTQADPVDVEPPGPLAAPDEDSDAEPPESVSRRAIHR